MAVADQTARASVDVARAALRITEIFHSLQGETPGR